MKNRDMFVQQFWQQRNPAGTGANAFKIEHYRRIAFANEHFATSQAGWQTNRGHIYIVYGPPDEIEAHPAEAETHFPSQVWMYHHVEGIGDNLTISFVDRTGAGDYTLAPGNPR